MHECILDFDIQSIERKIASVIMITLRTGKIDVTT